MRTRAAARAGDVTEGPLIRTVLLRAAAVSALPLILSGCRLLQDGACGYDQRYVLARGVATEGGMETAYADVTVGGVRGSVNSRHFRWNVSTIGIVGQVTSITLVNSTQRVPVLLELPVTPVCLPHAFLGWITQESGETTPALEGLFEIVAANQAAIEITTDLPDRPLITIPLSVESNNDWSPSNDCYPTGPMGSV